jgi:hypothetical protein
MDFFGEETSFCRTFSTSSISIKHQSAEGSATNAQTPRGVGASTLSAPARNRLKSRDFRRFFG